jgi:hypothetical protein
MPHGNKKVFSGMWGRKILTEKSKNFEYSKTNKK